MQGEAWITDIHTHVLPGIDDGPATSADSQALLQAHQQSGTDRIFCTSHFMSPHFDTPLEAIHEAYASIGNFRDANVPEFEEGAEIRVSTALQDILLRNEIPSLGDTSYVLLEFPNSALNDQLLSYVHEVRIRGYQPIMAHPERNIAVQKDWSWIGRLTELGIYLQCTAQCFHQPPSHNAHMADKTAWEILERSQLTVIASDAHDVSYRPPGLLQAYETIAERYGQQVSDTLIANANAIWADKPVNAVVVHKPKRGLFGFRKKK